MKLERLPEYFISFVIILLGLAIALYIGLNAGSGGVTSIVLIVGALCFLVIGAVMGRHVWLLIPLAMAGSGKILGLPITMMEAGTVTAFGWWIIFAAFRKVPLRTPTNLGDILLFLNICYLVMSFVRNPAGGLLIESDRIGGRPYFSIIFACLAYWVLSRVDLNVIWARRLPWLVVLGSLPTLMASVVTRFVPGTGPVFGYILGVDASPNAEPTMVNDATVERSTFLAGPTMTAMTTFFARFPAKTFVNPLYVGRVTLLALGLAFMALSGFRAFLVLLGIRMLLIAWYQRCLGPLLRTSLFVLPIAILLIAAHGTFYTFPAAVQRSLSFLPGDWSVEATADASHSIEWRVEMWRMVLFEKQHIENRWLGDGFGYPLRDFEELLYASMNQGGDRVSQLFFIMTGTVHSGPLSLLRYVGYVGGVLFFSLLVYLGVNTHRLIKRAMGTPYQFAALTFGVPIVILPFSFVLIYGALESDFPLAAISLGMLNMMNRALDRYQREEKSKEAAQQALPPTTTEEGPGTPALV